MQDAMLAAIANVSSSPLLFMGVVFRSCAHITAFGLPSARPAVVGPLPSELSITLCAVDMRKCRCTLLLSRAAPATKDQCLHARLACPHA